MSEISKNMDDLSYLIHLYFHRSPEYDRLLKKLNLTDEIVSKAIERCKYDEHFRRNAKYSIILEDFMSSATTDEKFAVFTIFCLALLCESRK